MHQVGTEKSHVTEEFPCLYLKQLFLFTEKICFFLRQSWVPHHLLNPFPLPDGISPINSYSLSPEFLFVNQHSILIHQMEPLSKYKTKQTKRHHFIFHFYETIHILHILFELIVMSFTQTPN